MAVSCGARGLEAAVVLSGEADASTRPTCPSCATSPGPGVPVHLAAPDGTVVASVQS